jgi:hypothetical protein
VTRRTVPNAAITAANATNAITPSHDRTSLPQPIAMAAWQSYHRITSTWKAPHARNGSSRRRQCGSWGPAGRRRHDAEGRPGRAQGDKGEQDRHRPRPVFWSGVRHLAPPLIDPPPSRPHDEKPRRPTAGGFLPHLQDLRTFPGLRPSAPGSAPAWLLLWQGSVTTRAQDCLSSGPITCSPPKATLSWRFDSRISPSAGHQLRGCLATTPTGLSPASPSQLRRTHHGSETGTDRSARPGP